MTTDPGSRNPPSTRIGAIMRNLLVACGCAGSSSVMAQTLTPDTLFGVRLGLSLEQQCTECPKDAKGAHESGYAQTDSPCWFVDGYIKKVKLPRSTVLDMSHALGSDATIKTREGKVVEIEAYGDADSWRVVERHLLRRYGKPARTETFRRDSRLFGLSSAVSHTWHANGSSLHFTSRSGSDHVRVRAVDDAWEKLDAQEREERRARRQSMPM